MPGPQFTPETPPGKKPEMSPNGTTMPVLGILGMVLCAPLGVAALIMGIFGTVFLGFGLAIAIIAIIDAVSSSMSTFY